jgi:N-acetylmuramoyl-L-alanine amidase
MSEARGTVSVTLRRLGWCLVVCSALEAVDVSAAASRQLPESTAARLAGDEQRTRFVIDISRSVEFAAYVVPEPYRIVIDLDEVSFKLPMGLGARGLGLVRAYRYGGLNEGRSRIVMDAKGPVLIKKAFLVTPAYGQPARIVVDIVPTTPTTFLAHYRRQSLRNEMAEEAKQLADAATHVAAGTTDEETSSSAGKSSANADGSARVDAAPARLAMTVPTTSPAAKSGVGALRDPRAAPFKKAGVRTIVVDPGHGGIDPGALGKSGTKEKDVVLAFAREVEKQIEDRPGYEVVLTRSGDTFISLRDRVRIARSSRADLFIVVHADAVRNKQVRGATVYTLSEKASDAEAEELAHNENKSDLIAGVDLAEESNEIAGILIDLAQRETRNHAGFFARSVVRELKQATRFTGKPLRSAGFRVLRAPDVPSILLELGYLSHPADESQLKSAAWRRDLARRLVEAVDSYFKTNVVSAP